MDEIESLIAELQGASADRKAEVYGALEQWCVSDNAQEARSAIEKYARSQILTIQWELEEILERTAPEPVAAPEEPEAEEPETPEPEEGDTSQGLSAADVEMVYEDPRGLILHRTKTGDRWLATQMDPRTGQPQTFELHPQEIDQLKVQLAQSPYWVLGKKPTD